MTKKKAVMYSDVPHVSGGVAGTADSTPISHTKTKTFVGQGTSLPDAVHNAEAQCSLYLSESSVEVRMMTCTLAAGSARNEVTWGYIITLIVTEYFE